MELILNFFTNFLVLLDAMSIYIIVGLLFAGILKQIIPDSFVSSHLGKDSISSVIKATLFGIPLPVCSCSVIPLAQALRKEGASKGAVQSFLISTPITGVDSILATFSLFGIIFTTFRVISSIIIAITVGLVQNFIQKENNIIVQTVQTSCGCSTSNGHKKFSFLSALKYGYGTLFEDMAKALLIGLIIGALFVTFMPKEYAELLFDNQLLTYLVVLVFAIPFYTCATASLPIAAAFMMQGMTAGAVFIFLTAGPATSAITMSIVHKLLGRTSLIIYVSIIALLALLFGYTYDTFFKDLSLIPINMIDEEPLLINTLSSLLMLLLISYHLLKNRFLNKIQNNCSTQIKEDTLITKNRLSFSANKPNENTTFNIKPKNNTGEKNG